MELITELRIKYEIQRNTMRQLIDVTNGDNEPHELEKYKAVHRFICSFIEDLKALDS
jgi:hypothetical protein